MEPTDVTNKILQRIQEGIVGLRDDVNGVKYEITGLRDDVNKNTQEIAALRSNMESGFAATNAAIGVLTEQVGSFGRSATAAAEARLRQDERIDRLEQRVEALEDRDH